MAEAEAGDGWPLGARVQRVDTPSRVSVVLGLRWRQGETFAKGHLVLEPGGPVVLDERPKGEGVDGFGRRLRKLLTGARLVSVQRRGAAWRLGLARGRDQTLLWLTHEGGSPVGRDDEGRPLAGRTRMGAQSWGEGWETATDPPRRALIPRGPRPSPLRAPAKAKARALKRTLAKVEREVARADGATELRQRADLLKAHAHRWAAGDGTLEVTDFYADPPTTRQLTVDPSSGPSAEADAAFHRARRFERGAALGRERLRELRGRLEALEAWLGEEPDDPALRSAWEDRAVDHGLRTTGADAPSRRGSPQRLPYRRFRGAGDRAILVGRGARDNDELTLRVARPWDLWLHAKGRRGAHVVVPLEKKEACPPDLLADAATLAAHFSDAHGDALVEVSYCPRRYVHKRKGDPPGAVRPEREKIFAVRMDSSRVRAMLEREER